MKSFLLIAGSTYYPAMATGDWVGCYSTREEAREAWKKLKAEHEFRFDWHEIVDLREWLDGDFIEPT